MDTPSRAGGPLQLIVIGAASTFAGLGLGRFAYATLLPEMLEAGWFDAAEGGYIGAANLLGYLLGALGSAALMARFSSRAIVRLTMALIALSFVASAWPAPFAWFAFWRLIAGMAGAVLMVVGTSSMLGAMHESERKRGGPCLFLGIGLGMVASATLVPALMPLGLSAAWLGLTAVSLVPLWLALRPWPVAEPPSPTMTMTERRRRLEPLERHLRWPVAAVMFAYGLDAIGFVPHTLFWVDALERQLGHASGIGALQWGIFGLGALCGPFIAGFMASRLGWHRGLMTSLSIKGTAVALPVLAPAMWSVSLSSFWVGALIPATVALVSGRLSELGGATRHPALWGRATASFALAQAAGAYLFAALYAYLAMPIWIFALAAASLWCGVMLLWLSGRFAAAPLAASHPSSRHGASS
ncbi:YbfB/YjiJ family MFS transporter [Halomonas shantousis]